MLMPNIAKQPLYETKHIRVILIRYKVVDIECLRFYFIGHKGYREPTILVKIVDIELCHHIVFKIYIVAPQELDLQPAKGIG